MEELNTIKFMGDKIITKTVDLVETWSKLKSGKEFITYKKENYYLITDKKSS
jgi:hypothetical protein